MPITGYINSGEPGKVACQDLEFKDYIHAQQNFNLDDDLVGIARSMAHHPMVAYDDSEKKQPLEVLANTRWARLALSAVWLEDQGVYLAVSRTIFYASGNKQFSIISFLRGQIFDEGWNELKDYVLQWRGERITFPTIFNIPTPYEVGGCFYGPEDPRIIIEQDVDDPEPVIVFNMLTDPEHPVRAMYIHRPFSNDTAMLTINGRKRSDTEKNWAPFFYREHERTPSQSTRWPSQYLHFIYSFKPLRILKCHLLNGWCDFVFEQVTIDHFSLPHNDTHGRMSGGTNLDPLTIKGARGVQAFIGFPRTHIDVGCTDDSMYRPTLMILTATRNHFHIAFMSDSIDFGELAFTPEALEDQCGEGRILIANSIARWDNPVGQDVMTISFTVDDSTTQMLRLHGLWAFIQRLPHLADALKQDVTQGGQALWDLRWSAVGNDVLACSVEAAQNYSLIAAGPSNGKDLRKYPKEGKKVDDDKGEDTREVPKEAE